MKSDIVQKYGESVILEKLHKELDFFSPLFFFSALLGDTNSKNRTVLPAVEAQSCNHWTVYLSKRKFLLLFP